MQVTAREGYTGLANIVVEPFHLEMAYSLREKNFRAQLDAVRRLLSLKPTPRATAWRSLSPSMLLST